MPNNLLGKKKRNPFYVIMFHVSEMVSLLPTLFFSGRSNLMHAQIDPYLLDHCGSLYYIKLHYIKRFFLCVGTELNFIRWKNKRLEVILNVRKSFAHGTKSHWTICKSIEDTIFTKRMVIEHKLNQVQLNKVLCTASELLKKIATRLFFFFSFLLHSSAKVSQLAMLAKVWQLHIKFLLVLPNALDNNMF